MNKPVYRFIQPPVFPGDEEKTRTAAILNTILFGLLILFVPFTILQGFIGSKSYLTLTTAVLVDFLLVSVILLVLIRRGYVRLSAYILVIAGWIILNFQAWSYSGIRDAAFIASVVIIIAASLLINARASLGFAVASLAMGWVFAALETKGRYTGQADSPYPTAIAMTVIFLLVTLISYLAITNLNQSLRSAQKSAQALKTSNLELQTLQSDLEKRVAERTTELTTALELNRARSNQLKAISDVARRVSMVQEIDILLPTVTRLISERFGYYHVGIFLVDEKREYAVLKAANSEGGQRMLKRGHKLQVGQTGMVGFVTSTGTPRVARNVGVDAIYFRNPDLPDTKAEMTLPLLIGNQVIGALDIQSDVESTLDDETLDAMRTLADQVAIAIETARLIGETRQALEQSQRIYRQYVQQEWLRLAEERQELGYQRNPDGIQPLLEPLDRAEVREVFHTGMIAYAQDESFAIAIPIKLREEILGVLDINASNSPRQWTPDDITLLKAVADRIALAMENARLIEETSRRANRERTVSEITTKIRSNTDPQSMLQTALEELKHVLGTDRIQVVPQRPGSRSAEPPAKDPSTQ